MPNRFVRISVDVLKRGGDRCNRVKIHKTDDKQAIEQGTKKESSVDPLPCQNRPTTFATYLSASSVQIHAVRLQHSGRQPCSFSDDAEQHLLGANVIVSTAARFLERIAAECCNYCAVLLLCA